MENFGTIVRRLREDKQLPLREVSADLGIDQAIISKLERGQRRATAEQVQKLAAYYQADQTELMNHWLSDRIAGLLQNHEQALDALELAREKVLHQAGERYDRESVFHQIYNVFRRTNHRRVWVFGDYASGANIMSRHLQVLVEPAGDEGLSAPQQQSLRQRLQQATRLKVTLHTREAGTPLPMQVSESQLILIWERPA
jgi:transcriptional regulator with XRE-family HTH domain